MSSAHQDSVRAETDASLRTERENTDEELGRRVVIADTDADATLRRARERADRLLEAARSAADARLPLSEQTEAAVALLLREREAEDLAIMTERSEADELLERERRERRDKLCALLALERQTTNLHLALERKSADGAVASRDDFLAKASHDLRGLMAAQKLYLALLLKEAGEDGPRQQLVALMKISAQMERLIGDLVDVVALDGGRLSVAPRSCSAAELLATSAALFEPLARERGQTLAVAPIAGDVRIAADLERAVQVLGNLLSNAIKFTPSRGAIRVGFEAGDDEVTFFVEDTGPGVPADQAPHIFERFVGSRGSASGLGLGLYIANQLVAAHGGRLWFDREPGRGTVFRFTLVRA